MAKYNCYAVKQGRKTNVIVATWAECDALVTGVANDFKGFKSTADAQAWLDQSEMAFVVETKPTEVLAYTDGSFRNNKAGWAFSIWKNGEEIAFDSGTTPFIESNNIGAELAGAMYAMQWAKKNDTPVVIVHDYVGVAKWPLGEWKVNAVGLAKIHIKAYIELMSKNKAYIVAYKHINGHSGNPGNDRADALASIVTE